MGHGQERRRGARRIVAAAGRRRIAPTPLDTILGGSFAEWGHFGDVIADLQSCLDALQSKCVLSVAADARDVNPMKSLIVGLIDSNPAFRRALSTSRGDRIHSAEVKIGFNEVKKGDGNWAIPHDLKPDDVVYSFGIGVDKDFEDLLIAKFGVIVNGFDPAPGIIRWVSAQDSSPKFVFRPYGVSATGGDIKFTDYEDRSLTSVTEGYSGRLLSLPTKRLSVIMKELGHDHIDLLKMDIEGAEYDVIDEMIKGDILPKYLLIEFHHRMYGISSPRTEEAVRKLRKAGYRRYWVSDYGHEYAFVRQPTS